MANSEFFNMVLPYAKRASQALNIPVSVILAQWGYESTYGTSDVYKNNYNLAGIKKVPSSIAIGVSPSGYAKYSGLDQFTSDYIRVMNNGLYDDVKKAQSVNDTAVALGKSPWAGLHYVGSTGKPGDAILAVIKDNNLAQYDQVTTNDVFNMAGIGQYINGLSTQEKESLATIGAVAVLAVMLFKK
jgi:flagellum-specific peptidoglycan hydrolase FlgJ